MIFKRHMTVWGDGLLNKIAKVIKKTENRKSSLLAERLGDVPTLGLKSLEDWQRPNEIRV